MLFSLKLSLLRIDEAFQVLSRRCPCGSQRKRNRVSVVRRTTNSPLSEFGSNLSSLSGLSKYRRGFSTRSGRVPCCRCPWHIFQQKRSQQTNRRSIPGGSTMLAFVWEPSRCHVFGTEWRITTCLFEHEPQLQPRRDYDTVHLKAVVS